MKKLIKPLILLFGISFLFTGCYTIVWDPYQEFPNEETTYSDNNNFYGSDYYGGYGDYYEIPWWIGVPTYIAPLNDNDNNQTKDRNNGRTSSTENMRNSSGRGNTDRDAGIINTPPPSSSGSSGTVTKTKPTTRESETNNSSNNNSNTTSSSSSNNSRSSNESNTRNESGSRNTDSGRR